VIATGRPSTRSGKENPVLEAEYLVPHLPHMPMEPVIAVPHVIGDSCEVWAPTQSSQAAQREVVRVLSTMPHKVRVRHFLGVGFGEVKSRLLRGGRAVVVSPTRGRHARVHFHVLVDAMIRPLARQDPS
jgi:isoquinoline 1-oxidoreductase beta subunit